jgi:hypothetical protein
MCCYFDDEKINKSTQISELFTFQMSEADSMVVQYTFKHVALINLKSVINI